MNCRGLADRQKRRDVLDHLRSKRPSIVFLQDIHLDSEKARTLLMEWGLEGKIAPGSSNSRGTALLFNSNFAYRIDNTYTHQGGNYVIVDLTIQDQNITLCSVYGPNKDDPDFYRQMFQTIEQMGNDSIILGGDWNLVIDPELDYCNYKQINNRRARTILLEKIQEFDLVDVWRKQNESNRVYTWQTNDFRKQSRLDFFLVSENLVSLVQKTDIESGYRTDHSLVSLEIDTKIDKRGKGLWKFNVSLLQNEDYSQLVKNSLQECKELYAALPYDRKRLHEIPHDQLHLTISWKLFLDTTLMIIRGKTIRYAKKFKKENNEKENRLSEEINQLQKEIMEDVNVPNKTKTKKLQQRQQDLVDLRKRKIDGMMIRSRNRWYEKGEKNSSYFFHLEKRNFTEKKINRLIQSDGKETCNLNKIMDELYKFYNSLYNGVPCQNSHWCHTFDKNNINVIGDSERESLEGKIHYEELVRAVKSMKNNKTPGLDGYPIEFFKFFWKDFGTIILQAVNESYDDGEFSTVQREGVITCIPKTDKDRKYLKNWRPITLLNTLYKIASTCIANRLKTVMDSIISTEQKGFMKGRYIGENIRLVYDLLHYASKKRIPGLLMLVDFEKAFDTISRNFIFDCLYLFGFGQSLIRWIKTLYKYSSARVLQNGYLTKSIPISRGCRQGDPIASFLFLIGAEILHALCHQNDKIRGIRLNEKEHKIAQYADDTEFFLDGTEESLKATIETLKYFESISGLKVNMEKTRLIWFGSMCNSNKQICSNFDLDWNQGSFKVLGITFSTNLFEIPKLNYEGIVGKIKNVLKAWKGRKLTLIGKIKVIKTLALSKLTYFLMNIPRPPDNVIHEINKICFQFLWDDKPSKIKKDVVIKDCREGGLGMTDIQSFDKALKLTWMRRLLYDTYTRDYVSFSKVKCVIILKTGGSIDPNLISTLNPFWKEVLNHWNELLMKIEEPDSVEHILTEPLWNNSFLKEKYLFDLVWYNAGLRSVRDIIKRNGQPKLFSEIMSEYQVPNNFLFYNKIVNNIPRRWRQIIARYDRHDISEDFCSPLKTCSKTELRKA